MNLNLPAGKLIDISLPLDARTFHMRTYSGFKKDMQFEVEVIKGYEDGGYNQIVRGAHMRLHAGTHVDAQYPAARTDLLRHVESGNPMTSRHIENRGPGKQVEMTQ